MSTTLYLSGCEAKRLFQCAMRGRASSFLVSFWHMTTKRPDLLRIRKGVFPHHQYFVDSGAYTVLNEPGAEAQFKEQFGSLEAYVEAYAKFLLDNRDFITVAVEFDIEERVGYGQVLKWQEKYFEPLEHAGMEIIYVWHPHRGLKELEAMAKRHPYIGIARGELQEHNMTFQDVERIVKKYLTKVHGFGITSWKQLKSGIFYSADSTTWLVGQQYGEICTFRNGKYVRKHWKELHQEAWFKPYVEELGYNYGLLTSEDLDATIIRDGIEVIRWEETSAICAEGFVRMIEDYQKMNKNGFWEFRLPFPDLVEKFTEAEVSEWTQKMGLSEKPLKAKDALSRLQWISRLQYGDGAWIAEHVAEFVDDYMVLLGNNAPSLTDPDSVVMARTALNLSFLPSAGRAFKRSRPEDFIPEMVISKRTNEEEDELPHFERSNLRPAFPRVPRP